MANAQAMCNSFKVDSMNAVHAFGAAPIRSTTAKDTFYGALYVATAALGAGTTAYTTTGEVTGSGYNAGGAALTTATPPSLSGTTAMFTPSASLVFPNVNLTTPFDCLLIYNATAAGKNAVSTHTFASQTVLSGTFTLSMPPNDAANALIRFG